MNILGETEVAGFNGDLSRTGYFEERAWNLNPNRLECYAGFIDLHEFSVTLL